ncbi:MAG: cysteine--tRNA ligase [SAR202 cluster bacterium Casp-Chloro-G4]|nr:cysteine--tRNA ligase [Chloroflexota bacterium]MDA1228031.1 cysteine--tRNA ligase [Chloroflexota bacterium]PKB61664.1 MAG: cysteine--tRNA ligase [SAR202 cluster bacterium Casp-Chloro-G4]
MKLYNTLTGEKEEFTTADGKVRMYVCGITPYSSSHIGHAMFSVVFDVVRRYMEHKGFKIKHVQNFTDIDDKMIAAANSRGITVEELAEENIQQYLEETDALNIRRAHQYPRATKEIPKIISMIKGLEDGGYAYSTSGDVYFRVNRDEDYGKLSGRNAEDLLAGARVELGEIKEDPRDFALWKTQKPGEPAWDSPWGPGRPGWHIECSAMSMKYLGETIDIHGGGQDLIFPHHENEIAQSESFTSSEPFARFWMHNGLLSIGEDKMSKSIGNVISVRQALDQFSPAALRLFFLSSHYRNPLVYSEQNIAAQERAIERLRYAAKDEGDSAQGEAIHAESYQTRFTEAMDDDLNTPRALAVLFDLSHDINRGREEGKDVSPARKGLREMADILGIDLSEPDAKSGGDAAPFVDLLIEIRSQLRAAKQFEISDQIRDKLAALGVTLEDSAGGTGWKIG